METHNSTDTRPSKLGSLLGLLLFVGISFGAAAIGSALTMLSVNDWYPRLEKPAWTPPDWLFAPVWTLLFLIMAVTAWMVWKIAGLQRARCALSFFAVQLALNCLWSGLFFGFRMPGLALVEIILWAAIALMIAEFLKLDQLAGLLNIPYLLWVSYALALNGAIWWMNG